MTNTEFIEQVNDFIRMYCNDCGLSCNRDKTTFDMYVDDPREWLAEVEVESIGETFYLQLIVSRHDEDEIAIVAGEDSELGACMGGLFCILFHEAIDRLRESQQQRG